MSKITSVIFRMYDTGSVGDCLLLLFKKKDDVSFKMLIDCGGWQTNAEKVKPVAQDIFNTCGGKLDLLVMTHQHKDHLSGFNFARSIFDKIEVDQVWMSWMENPKDTIAKIVKDKFGKKIKALLKEARTANEKYSRLTGMKYKATKTGPRLMKKAGRMQDAIDLLEFQLGLDAGPAAAKKAAQTNQDAVDYLKKKGKLTYWKPGQVATGIKGAEGVKFFMLGPPRDADMKLFFTRTEVESEIYKLAAGSPSVTEEVIEEKRILSTPGLALKPGYSPFADRYLLTGAERKDWQKWYDLPENNWRQIETDGDDNFLQIALRANAYTNNTSFAMAIEVGDKDQVILLPGDAQSGNWMGWHKPDVMKELKTNGGKNTDELLANTIFYKVGHHNSKNGTAAVSGLDKMTSPNLVAFATLIKKAIPREWHPEGFPAKPLYKKLIKSAQGRVVRLDEGVIKDPRAKDLREQMPASQRKAFENAYRKGSCFHEFTIGIQS
jgi:beta-lactamase superfamily II metal-dependent hydrolase